jgi:hypothetical protein
MKMKHAIRLAPLCALLFAGCGDPETSADTGTGGAPSGSALDAVFVDAAPAGAQAIHVVRTDAKPGDELTVSGLVMGTMEPFVSGRAAFVLGDPEKLTPCNQRPDDECETPWDVCCDSKEDIRVGTATVQVIGDDKRVLKTAIEGVGGLGKLSSVVVKGTVAEGSTADALVINATAIHVVK